MIEYCTDPVGFSQNVFTVHEYEDSINIAIFSYISVTAFDEITVNFTTFNESATEGKLDVNSAQTISLKLHCYIYHLNVGEDYLGLTLQIPIIGNHSTVATISIPISNDYLAEGLEIFSGMLEVVSQTQNLSFVSIIHIEIIDDEGKKGRHCNSFYGKI